jgi:hypothetical protein
MLKTFQVVLITRDGARVQLAVHAPDPVTARALARERLLDAAGGEVREPVGALVL